MYFQHHNKELFFVHLNTSLIFGKFLPELNFDQLLFPSHCHPDMGTIQYCICDICTFFYFSCLCLCLCICVCNCIFSVISLYEYHLACGPRGPDPPDWALGRIPITPCHTHNFIAFLSVFLFFLNLFPLYLTHISFSCISSQMSLS